MLLLPSDFILPPRRRDAEKSNQGISAQRSNFFHKQISLPSPRLCVSAVEPLPHLLDNLLQLRRHFRNRHTRDLHLPVGVLLERQIELRRLGILVGIIFAEMPAATLLAFDRR